jgi:hypothetical protein
MSDRGTPGAESESKPQWPAPHMCTGAGKDRDPQQIKVWFQAIVNYINSYGFKKTNLDALQYYSVLHQQYGRPVRDIQYGHT